MTLRCDYGEAPMGSAPHGSLTVVAPGSQCPHTGAAGWEPVMPDRHRKYTPAMAANPGTHSVSKVDSATKGTVLLGGSNPVGFIGPECQEQPRLSPQLRHL